MIDLLGPGALGLHCALSLPESSAVRLRHPQGSGEGWTVRRNDGFYRTLPCLNLSDPSPIEYLIVTTKATEVIAAVTSVLPHLKAHAEILLLHNGLGPQDIVAKILRPTQRLYVGISTEGVIRLEPQHIQHRSVGLTQVGPWRDGHLQPKLFALLAAGSWAMQWWENPADTLRLVWQKLVINAAINPLTALHNVSNGALVAAELQAQWRPVVLEACAIATAIGVTLEATTQGEQVLAVIQSTANNYSSMWQDWALGRSSEVDFILLPLINTAQQHHLKHTALSELYQQVKLHEQTGLTLANSGTLKT